MQSQKQCGVGNPGELGQQALVRRIIAGPDRNDDLCMSSSPLSGTAGGANEAQPLAGSTAQPFRIRTL
ncbi:hypothetical protein [Streptomyces zaomyceticus]|uniref:hypothetical protein n=1 Tax=Streptomyces zaomyceticus TaxID=68286 RepID=UPI002E20A5D3